MAKKKNLIIEDDEPEDDDLVIRKQLVGKYITVLKDPYMLWEIRSAVPGLPVPKELQGCFTTIGFAEKAIESYNKLKGT